MTRKKTYDGGFRWRVLCAHDLPGRSITGITVLPDNALAPQRRRRS
jgi:hypothetical protein